MGVTQGEALQAGRRTDGWDFPAIFLVVMGFLKDEQAAALKCEPPYGTTWTRDLEKFG
jgi:hypothetical protein